MTIPKIQFTNHVKYHVIKQIKVKNSQNVPFYKSRINKMGYFDYF